MVYKLGKVEDMNKLPIIESTIHEYIKYLLLVLDTEYGIDRDIDSNDGGYIVYLSLETHPMTRLSRYLTTQSTRLNTLK